MRVRGSGEKRNRMMTGPLQLKKAEEFEVTLTSRGGASKFSNG
jgi:hypothetical protein